ncbi:MAG TPA: hypothetical protein VHR66_04420 [Gemmataceae bacterium]|jgi:CheY-like chemotaxis protein|nr:hypothetical protein [Gemmataceae bacterium]
MASIIVVDDKPKFLALHKGALEAAGHDVIPAPGSSAGEVYETLKNRLGGKRDTADFLYLDVHLGNDMFGGIHLYNMLVGGGYRYSWSHTLVVSTLACDPINLAAWDTTSAREDYLIRVFVETARIPYENVFRALSGGHGAVMKRIADLAKQPLDTRCTVCDQLLEWR